MVGIILALASLVRFAALSKLMVFTSDEEYLLYIAQTLIKNFHIIWIGVSALGFDFYMGPFWIYFIYPFVTIFKGDPLILGIISSAFGVFTTFLVYWLGRKMFTRQVGLIASLAYAASALIVYYDQQPYPTGVPLLSLLIVSSLYMTKYSKKWWVMFGIFYGLVFHVHLSLVLTIFVALYWALARKKSLDKKIVISAIIAFLVTISPLIAFDYFHKASNITAPIRVIKSIKGRKANLDIGSRLNSLFLSLGRLWYLNPRGNSADEILHPCRSAPGSTFSKPPWFFTAISIVLLIAYVIKKNIWQNENKRLLLLHSLSFLVPFTLLSAINPIEYYLLGFFPIFFLISASVIESVNAGLKYLSYILVALFAIHSIFTIFTANGDHGLGAKKKLVTEVMNIVGENTFELEQAGGCQKYSGWRYLYSVYGRRPERSSEDKTFAWLYPDEVSILPARYTVIMKESRSSDPIPTGFKYSLQEGGFTAYIFEHLTQNPFQPKP